ncbi:hypothetical protein Q2T40_09835 [Winogradskyella maritima]|uniref:SMP-30/gluconolactonase/LRE family protein n=1 Tax=Winogradskyella maritima TaxID=1517766 RepID=A0ABV8ACS1_9FLAO|nr:hypothetical protein [Winogradskyella maritima]
MKSTLLALLAFVVLSSCKNDTKTEESTTSDSQTEISALPTATFTSETLGLKSCESAVYDATTNHIYASLIGGREEGDGSIAKLKLDGTLVDSMFIINLNDPKGIVVTGDKLFVSDVKHLVEADVNTGVILNTYTQDSVNFLNDVEIDSEGNIYVSDTSNSEIYKLDTKGNFELWLADEALDRPNGLLYEDGTMYVASWGASEEGGRVSKIDMQTKQIDYITRKIGNLDGIRPYGDGRLLISDWRSGNIHLISMNGEIDSLTTVGMSVGDIAYIKDKSLLFLPMNRQSRLLFYNLK